MMSVLRMHCCHTRTDDRYFFSVSGCVTAVFKILDLYVGIHIHSDRECLNFVEHLGKTNMKY